MRLLGAITPLLREALEKHQFVAEKVPMITGRRAANAACDSARALLPSVPPQIAFLNSLLETYRTFSMDCTGYPTPSRSFELGLWLSCLFCFAPGVTEAQMLGFFAAERTDSGNDQVSMELDSSLTTKHLLLESAVEVSGIAAPAPLDLTIPVSTDSWQSVLSQPVAYLPEKTLGHPGGSAESSLIPREILSREESRAIPPTVADNVVQHPIIPSAGSESEFSKEENEAGFRTEMEILESLWNIDFKLGMQETSDFSNRVRFGTVARYKTSGQSLKVDMDFERNQGEAEQISNQLRLGTLASYRWKGKAVEVDLKYERRQDEQENVTNRLLFDGTHEWFFNATRWSHYLGGKIEYDQLRDFDRRFETNTGFAYSVLKNRSSHVKLKAGATVVREIGVEREENGIAPDSTYGVSVNQKVTNAHKISTKVDYIPQWSDLKDYEVRSEANLNFVLDEALDLRLQVGARNRYESSMPIESIEEGTEYTGSLMLKY